MKKVFFVIFAMLTVAMMVLTACAPAAVPTPEKVVETVVVEKEVEKTVVVEKPTEAGELNIWGFYDLTNTEDSRPVMLKQAIDSFQATTGIKVNYEQVAWDQMAKKVALAAQSGGDMPDLIMIAYEYVQGLVNAGALMDIKSQIESTFFYNDLNEFEKMLNEEKGKRYAVGTFVGGGNWYYDVEMLPNGLPAQANDWMAECERLKKEGKFLATFFAGRHSAAVQQGLAPLVWSAGGQIFDEEGKPVFANEATVEAINWWRTLLQNKCVPEVAFTGDWSATEAPFVDRSAAAVRGGTWSYIYITGLKERFESGKVKIGVPPGMKGNQGYVFMNTETWAVTSGAKNVDNAIAFINFFYNPAVLAPWAKANYGIPATASALQNPIFESQFYADSRDNLTKHGHKSDVSPYYNETMDALAAVTQELVLNPSLDVMEKLKQAQDEILTKYW